MAIRNVLFIMTDQQRKDSLGCYGDRGGDTPNLDSLAANGIAFERCYVTNPICMPSRLSIFTGMYPHNHGMWTNGLLMDQELPTLPGYLGQNGFHTASFGKIHFSPSNSGPQNKEGRDFWVKADDNFDWNGPYWGFKTVELALGHTSTLAHYGRWFRQNGGTEEMLKMRQVTGDNQAGARMIPPELHDSTFVAERVSDFLVNGRDKTKPFFICASFPDPHHPFNPPEVLAQKYRSRPVRSPIGDFNDLATRPRHYTEHLNGAWNRWGNETPKHPGGLTAEQTNERIYLTHAMIDLIDTSVGKILDTLKQENLLDETLIIFTSDHGELLGDHGLWLKGPFFYEGLINIPLIISCPGLPAGKISDNLASHVDLYPTICELLGLPVPPQIMGTSLVRQLKTGEPTRDRCLVEYRNGYGNVDVATALLIDKDYKFAANQSGEYELTDLRSDPFERVNIASGSPQLVCQYSQKLLNELISTGNRFPAQVGHA
ncbi:MAG: sulfatase-like hydrolase/transferase [Treponema sp.]|nr:sulfatase-like hydrolase/transferase [Treponema sp.]